MNETGAHDYRRLFDLSGKIAVVTGACGTLGPHFCAGLAAHGAAVVVTDLDSKKSIDLAERLTNDYGVRSLGLACDVGSPESVDSMTAKVLSEYGQIDILHNNAQGSASSVEKELAPAEDYDLDTWRELMRVNLDGMFLVARSVGRSMINAKRGGSIIQTSSIYGVVAPDPRIYDGSFFRGHPIRSPMPYSAGKAGVDGLTRYLAAYWAEHGIRVNSLVPGGVRGGQNDVFIGKYSNRVPLGRMAEAHEMVGALIWLASDASSYVTGQTICVDGGLTAW